MFICIFLRLKYLTLILKNIEFVHVPQLQVFILLTDIVPGLKSELKLCVCACYQSGESSTLRPYQNSISLQLEKTSHSPFALLIFHHLHLQLLNSFLELRSKLSWSKLRYFCIATSAISSSMFKYIITWPAISWELHIITSPLLVSQIK